MVRGAQRQAGVRAKFCRYFERIYLQNEYKYFIDFSTPDCRSCCGLKFLFCRQGDQTPSKQHNYVAKNKVLIRLGFGFA